MAEDRKSVSISTVGSRTPIVVVREEARADADAIHHLVASAFPSDAEARRVRALREAGALTLSLVAELDGEWVGHVAFSPVVVDGPTALAHGVGLAPLAVCETHRRRGIGGASIAHGLERLRTAGHRFCVVLGHPSYYPRHGFRRASLHGLRWERAARDEAFMVQALVGGGLDGVSGTVRYRPELGTF